MTSAIVSLAAAPALSGRANLAPRRLRPSPRCRGFRQRLHNVTAATAAAPKDEAVSPKSSASQSAARFMTSNVITPKPGPIEDGPTDVVSPESVASPLNSQFTSPLLRTPLSGGVENVSGHYELPGPAVSVRNLMEQALFGDLCTKMSPMDHRRAGWPVASLVDFATDAEGTPIFSLSPMAMHTRNMNYDPRCSLVVEMPGWRGLASARVTLFGTVKRVPEEQQDLARALFKAKHDEEHMSYGTSEFPLFMLTDIQDVYFVGGYGSINWLSAKEYLSARADPICDRALGDPLDTLNRLNEIYRSKVTSLFSDCVRGKIISVDARGMDMRVRTNEGHYVIQRVRFHEPAHSLEDAKREIDRILTGGFKTKVPSAR